MVDGVYGISPQYDFEGQQNGQHKLFSECIIQLNIRPWLQISIMNQWISLPRVHAHAQGVK